MLNLLLLNRNCALIADRDDGPPLKPGLVAIQAQMEVAELMCWVCAGREVEQYIPQPVLDVYFKNEANRKQGYAPAEDLGPLLPNERFGEYWHRATGYALGSWKNSKTKLAREVAPLLTRESLAEHSDLSEKLTRLCGLIRVWNGLE